MKFKRKIWAIPVMSTIIFSLGVAASTAIATSALESIHTTESVDYPVLDAAKSITLEIGAVGDSLRAAVAEGDKSALDRVNEQVEKLQGKLNQFSALPGQRDSGSRMIQQFNAYYAPALAVARIMLELDKGNPQESVVRMQSALMALNAELDATNLAAQRQFKNGIGNSEASVRKVLSAIILTALAVIASLVMVSFFVIKATWQQLGGEPEYAREIARAVADGDLSMEISTDAKDSGSLLVALKEMRAKLGNMVADIKAAADTIRVASAEIAVGNADLAARTESQAGNLERTARSMEKLTGTVRQNAGNADQANALVISATSLATRGGQVVSGVVTTMGEINRSATKIVEIISVIDGIAFQTNILALNAAVEAARAGEQGRGFAVVAAEVRNLAQRSAAAAKEIKELIGDSVAKVNAGTLRVDEAGVTMGQIEESVRKVAHIMIEISAAGQEQSAGIGDIGNAIDNMDEMTQQNAALVEQAAAAAESLTEQTTQLSGALAVFKLAQVAIPALKPKAARLALEHE